MRYLCAQIKLTPLVCDLKSTKTTILYKKNVFALTNMIALGTIRMRMDIKAGKQEGA